MLIHKKNPAELLPFYSKALLRCLKKLIISGPMLGINAVARKRLGVSMFWWHLVIFTQISLRWMTVLSDFHANERPPGMAEKRGTEKKWNARITKDWKTCPEFTFLCNTTSFCSSFSKENLGSVVDECVLKASKWVNFDLMYFLLCVMTAEEAQSVVA